MNLTWSEEHHKDVDNCFHCINSAKAFTSAMDNSNSYMMCSSLSLENIMKMNELIIVLGEPVHLHFDEDLIYNDDILPCHIPRKALVVLLQNKTKLLNI